MLRLLYTFVFILGVWVSNGLKAQCWPTGITHDTRTTAQWLSCESSPSPNSERGESFWLMYDLGYTYPLTTSTIWNYNVPGSTRLGATRIAVDYSLDGQIWQSFGEVNLDTASGKRDYLGQPGPDFAGTRARFVLFTVLETAQTNMTCAGLGEVRFNLEQTLTSSFSNADVQIKVFPNPTLGPVEIEIPGIMPDLVFIYDDQGRLLATQKAQSEKVNLDLKTWLPGLYLIRVVGKNGQEFNQKLVLK